ncbi:hypothetical protein MD484_g7228, partial [Candolleomyces efflorescens]
MALPLAAHHLERRLTQHTIYVVFFDYGWQASKAPTAVYPLQGVPTWPYIDLAETDLAYCLGPAIEDISEMELLEPCLGFWLTTLQYPLKVYPMQDIYIRRMGVNVPPEALKAARDSFARLRKRVTDSMIFAEERPRQVQPRAPAVAPATVTFTVVKRERADPPPNAQPQMQGAAPASQATSGVGQPGPAGPSRTIVPGNAHAANHILPHDPEDAYLMRWPSDLFVCDIARGFELLSQRSSRSLEERFTQLFPGFDFKPSTFHDNRKFWRSLPADVRAQAMQLPRTTEGLWKAFRKSRPEWRDLMTKEY